MGKKASKNSAPETAGAPEAGKPPMPGQEPLATVGDAVSDEVMRLIGAEIGQETSPAPEPEKGATEDLSQGDLPEEPERDRSESAPETEADEEEQSESEQEDGEEEAGISDDAPIEDPAETAESDATKASSTPPPDGAEPETGQEDENLLAQLTEDAQHALDKRIGKEVARRKALEERIAELEARIEGRGEGRATGNDGRTNALETAQTPEAVERIEEQARDAADAAERMLGLLAARPERVEAQLRREGIKLTNEDGQEEYTPERMSEFLWGVKEQAKRVERQAPKRREALRVTTSSAHAAVKLLPELKDSKSKRYGLWKQVLEMAPMLKQEPNWPLAAAIHVLGLERWLDMQKTESRPAKAEVRSAKVTIPKPRAAPAPSGRRAGTGAGTDLDRSESTGNREQFTEYLAKQLGKVSG